VLGPQRLRVMTFTRARQPERQRHSRLPDLPAPLMAQESRHSIKTPSFESTGAPSVEPRRSYTRDVLIIDARNRVWAQVPDIGDAGTRCGGRDVIFIDGRGVRVARQGLLVSGTEINYRSLLVFGNPDPKGCLRSSVLLKPGDQAGSDEADAGAVAPGAPWTRHPMPGSETGIGSSRSPVLELVGTCFNEVGKVAVVFERPERGRRAMGGRLLFLKPGEQDPIGEIRGVPRDAILGVERNGVRLRYLNDLIRLGSNSLSATVRCLELEAD